jgi:hypothetical protein
MHRFLLCNRLTPRSRLPAADGTVRAVLRSVLSMIERRAHIGADTDPDVPADWVLAAEGLLRHNIIDHGDGFGSSAVVIRERRSEHWGTTSGRPGGIPAKRR